MYLNSTKIPGHSLKIAVGFNQTSDDMSGNSSATAQAETGDKGMEVTVTTYIKFTDAADLSLLTALALSKDGNGSRTVYNINEPTCAAMKLRQVVFNANFNVRPDESLHQWIVSFNLLEYKSVAERKEERQPKKAAKTQPAAGNNATSTATATPTQGATATPAASTAQADTPEPLTGFEKILKVLDDKLK